jgi:hypothetical protein
MRRNGHQYVWFLALSSKVLDLPHDQDAAVFGDVIHRAHPLGICGSEIRIGTKTRSTASELSGGEENASA